MSDLAIQVQDLGKEYRIGQRTGDYPTLREALTTGVKRLTQWKRRASDANIFWALKHVSCEIKQGEVVGIIGRNGAGKSTLLKVLSHITEPSQGRVTLHGRVGSLLEVGTGFHPELSGRENIFLNGAILGMTRAEIERKFDEIVDFAEIERFLDTPVKRYSSGMYVRLAFAVAAHLEPEILLVDEVLAVGDAEFQKKCMGKMGSVAREGRTVLFVSHNLGAIGKLCPRSILLSAGDVLADGESRDVVRQYMQKEFSDEASRTFPLRPDKKAQIVQARLTDSAHGSAATIPAGEEPLLEISYRVNERVSGCQVVCYLYSSDGCHIFTSADTDTVPDRFGTREPGSYRTQMRLPVAGLNTGIYLLNVGVKIPKVEMLDFQEALSFRIVDSGSGFGSMKDGANRAGLMLVEVPWETLA